MKSVPETKIISVFLTLILSIASSQTVSASILDNLFGSGHKNYENPTYHIKVDYPSDWKYSHPEIDREVQPETVFKVMFMSPYDSGNFDESVSVTIGIDKHETSVTLDEYTNRIMKNLKEATGDVKDLTLVPAVLDGEQANRIEYEIWLLDHWERSISVYSVKNGILNEISALSNSEGMRKHSQSIENMFKSVSFQ